MRTAATTETELSATTETELSATTETELSGARWEQISLARQGIEDAMSVLAAYLAQASAKRIALKGWPAR